MSYHILFYRVYYVESIRKWKRLVIHFEISSTCEIFHWIFIIQYINIILMTILKEKRKMLEMKVIEKQ